MRFHKILSPIDFSTESREAMRLAVRLAKDTGSELVLTHAWSAPPIAYPEEPLLFSPDLVERIAADATQCLDQAVRETTALGAKPTSRLLEGPPWVRIVELLEHDPGFDLVVMGTHGRTGPRRFLLGSVAEKVVRHAPCSVLVARPDGKPAPFTDAVCPVDFSASSDYAIELAAQLVRPGGSGITLLHVVEAPVMYSGEALAADFLRDLDKEATRALDERAAKLRASVDVPVTTRTRIGYAGSQILDVLDDDPTYDLVVVGSHGRTGIRRALLGSVAEKVVRHARCPVLVARRRTSAS